MSLLCDMYSEKSFYHSLIWKELTENVSIAWYKLEKHVVLFTSNSLKIPVLFDVWKCVVLFGNNSMKVSALFDMKSEVFAIVGSNCLKV